MRFLASILACCFAASCFGAGHELRVNNSLSLSARYWSFRGASRGMPIAPYAVKPQGWYFNFPVSPLDCADTATCNRVDYVQTRFDDGTALLNANAITMTFAVTMTSGAPVFDLRTDTSNNCQPPVYVRFLIERWADIGCGADWGPPIETCQYWRWWSNPVAATIDPAAGTVTMTAALGADALGQWTSVFGRGNSDSLGQTGWFECLQNVGFLGFTFGSACGFGHGCFIEGGTGSAKFTLLDFRLE